MSMWCIHLEKLWKECSLFRNASLPPPVQLMEEGGKLGRATQWNFHKTMFTKYLMYLVSQLSHNLWITSTAVFRCGLWGHFNWLLLIMPCIWYCFWDHRICYWYSKWDSFHSKLLWPNHVTYFIVIANSLLT